MAKDEKENSPFERKTKAINRQLKALQELGLKSSSQPSILERFDRLLNK